MLLVGLELLCDLPLVLHVLGRVGGGLVLSFFGFLVGGSEFEGAERRRNERDVAEREKGDSVSVCGWKK